MPNVLKYREIIGEYQQEIEIPMEYFDNAQRNSFLSAFLRKMRKNFGPEKESMETQDEKE